MHYDFTAVLEADVPQAIEPVFQHVVVTCASEANKTTSVWRAVLDDLLDFKPHKKTNPIRTILVHQLLSERRFFAQFVGTEEPPVEELLPPGDRPTVSAYLDKYIGAGEAPAAAVGAGHRRLVAGGPALLRRLERIWVFWRRVPHTCHHRTQVQSWLRLAGHEPIPAVEPVSSAVLFVSCKSIGASVDDATAFGFAGGIGLQVSWAGPDDL